MKLKEVIDFLDEEIPKSLALETDEIGFKADYDGAQDYDIFLRMSEVTKPENIKHIPKILYAA